MKISPIIKPREVTIRDFKEITVAIDSLDDIFSDFDPRPLQQRALSEDFLKEIQKFYRETGPGKMLVTFLAPVALKDSIEKNQLGKAILTHLNHDFKRRNQANKKIMARIWRMGIILILFGMSVLLTLLFLGYRGILNKLSLEILGVVFMPLGWFGIWEGFSKIVDTPLKLKDETDMYERLAKAQYSFKYLGDTPKSTEAPTAKI